MRDPFGKSLNNLITPSTKRYKPCKATVVQYSSTNGTATVVPLGSNSGPLRGIPVALSCQSTIMPGQIAIIVFTDDASAQSAVIVATY